MWNRVKRLILLKALKKSVPRESIVFIDDTISHLDDFAKEMPHGYALRMCRIGAKGSDISDHRFINIKNFDEAKEKIVHMS